MSPNDRRRSDLGAFLSAYAVAWGGWLLLPMQTFTETPVYATMAVLAPEWVWGILVAGLGLVSLTARHYRWRRVKLVVRLGLGLLFTAMALASLLSSLSSVGGLTFASFAAGNYWLSIRLWSDTYANRR